MVSLFRLIGWRNLLIFILAAGAILMAWRLFFSQSKQEMRVSALFDQVEFVQELELVTYYSEEILEVGATDPYGRRIEELQVEINTLKGDSTRYDTLLKFAQQQVNHDRHRYQLSQAREQEVEDSLQLVSGKMTGGWLTNDWRLIERALEADPNAYDDQVAQKYAIYQSIEGQDREHAQLFRQSIIERVKTLSRTYEQVVARLKGQRGRLRAERNMLRASLKSAEADLQDAFLNRGEATERIKALTRERLEQQALRQHEGEITPPKLLAVVSTAVSARSDLSQVGYEVIDDSTLRFTCLPRAEIDPRVQMDLADETGRFSLASGLNQLFADQDLKDRIDKDQSLYLQAYVELKEAMEQARQKVIYQAYERGILAEADQLTQTYLAEMAQALGFTQVTFGQACNADQEQAEASALSPVDSTIDQRVDSLTRMYQRQ
jgi:hypothetical protein